MSWYRGETFLIFGLSKMVIFTFETDVLNCNQSTALGSPAKIYRRFFCPILSVVSKALEFCCYNYFICLFQPIQTFEVNDFVLPRYPVDPNLKPANFIWFRLVQSLGLHAKKEFSQLKTASNANSVTGTGLRCRRISSL